MTEIDDSLSQSELVEIVHQLNVQMDDVEDTTAVKEKDIIHSNRVKLTDYIHDSTVLFPYMKQHGVFSVYDCDVIKGTSNVKYDIINLLQLECPLYLYSCKEAKHMILANADI